MQLPYNPRNKESVLAYAKKLRGKTLREVCDASILEHTYLGKGNFGQILEKYYFQYEPNSDSQADFFEIGMELKSTPLKQLNNLDYRSKERLVLNIINYLEVVNQDFETSTFWKKNSNLLLVFYLRDEFNGILDYIIKLVDEWNFPLDDLKIIKNDWQIIKNKIVSGNAHELSEGDTFYLGACTKGGKGGNLRNQPNNNILAKQRAYSLKQGYVNHIIASISKDQSETFGKLIKPEEISSKSTIEDIVISKFSQYYKKNITEILKELNIEINQKAKGFYSSLTKAILGIELDKEIEEFQKADVTIKTIRLKENSVPKESVSFPAFKYEELVKEEWEDSRFREILEHKFLFVFFQFEGKNLILKKVRFWNMPYTDIDKVKDVWVKTKQVIESGNIVREVVNDIRYTNFPSKKENEISHVRPHAQNSNDTYPLPVKDILTNKMSYTKHCFWLNDTYIRDEIYLK